MRRVLALLGAVVLAASLAGPSLATGTATRVNRFIGSFDMVYEGQVVGHLVAAFKEPTDTQMVPGTIDIKWVEGFGSKDNPAFPFVQTLEWYPVHESHAQLLATWFGYADYPNPDGSPVHEFGASGYLCDYAFAYNADCRPFSVVFQTPKSGRQLGFAVDGVSFDSWFEVGRGLFSLTFVRPTGS